MRRTTSNIAHPAPTTINNRMSPRATLAATDKLIAGISNFTSPGDITTLANPEIVATIKHHVESEKVKSGQTPRQLTEKELEEIKAFGRAE